MKKFQRLVLLSLMASLLIGGFEYKLNAQIKSNVNQIAQGQSNPVRSPTPLTSVNPPDKLINQTPSTANDSSNDTDGPSVPDWLAWIGLFATLGCAIPLLSLFLKQKVWRLREDWPDIKKIKQLLIATIYSDYLLEPKIKQKINREIKNFIGLQQKIKKEEGLDIKLMTIARIRIEYQLVIKNPVEEDRLLIEKINQIISNTKLIKGLNQYELRLNNCFQILDKEETIKKYLQKIWDLGIEKEDEDTEFFCTVNIDDGFVAPLFLIYGPLRSFNEDWPIIIKEYHESLNQGDPTTTLLLQSLQSSNFATWISWGPSIPICTCRQWKRDGKNIAQLALQYGFGDENNSIPLLLPYTKEERDRCIRKIFSERTSSEVIVRKLAVTAKIVMLCKETRNQIAPAQRTLADDELEPVLKLNNADDVELKTDIRENAILDESIGYYTAYVWILFKVQRKNKAQSVKRWRSLLPFFEHINLADPLAYKIQKKLLIYKALDFIKDYLHASDPKLSEQIQFVYSCAFDHTNCRKSKDGQNLIINPEPEQSIKYLLEKFKNEEEYKGIPIYIPEDIPEDEVDISTCNLITLIGELNETLKDRQQTI